MAAALTVLVAVSGTLIWPVGYDTTNTQAPTERDAEAASRSLAREAAAATRGDQRRRRSALPPYRVIDAGKPLRLKPKPKPKPQPTPEPTPVAVDYSFDIGTYNSLGSNHTPPGSGWAPGPVRAGWAAGQIKARGIDVIGMQEVQEDQIRALRGALGGGYTVWPQVSLGRNSYRLQIAFRNDLFEIVDGGSITTVFSTQMRPVPWIKLRHRETGGEFYFVTVHNSPRDLEGERDRATAAEIALLRSLLSTGLPVFVVGDMNEREEFFCRVGAATGMVAANGGSATGGGCSVPGPRSIDWMMGGNGTDFSGYVRERLPDISDHPILHSSVTLTTTVPSGS